MKYKRGADYYIKIHNLNRECQCCHNTTWLGKPIPLEIHHINGDKTNNSDDNIMILCPNCHYFTDNYKAKNRKNSLKKEYYCKNCGRKLYGKTKTGLCLKCIKKEILKNSVCNDYENLKKDISELKSYRKVAKKYGVSDKTVAKWCDKFGIKK